MSSSSLRVFLQTLRGFSFSVILTSGRPLKASAPPSSLSSLSLALTVPGSIGSLTIAEFRRLLPFSPSIQFALFGSVCSDENSFDSLGVAEDCRMIIFSIDRKCSIDSMRSSVFTCLSADRNFGGLPLPAQREALRFAQRWSSSRKIPFNKEIAGEFIQLFIQQEKRAREKQNNQEGPGADEASEQANSQKILTAVNEVRGRKREREEQNGEDSLRESRSLLSSSLFSSSVLFQGDEKLPEEKLENERAIDEPLEIPAEPRVSIVRMVDVEKLSLLRSLGFPAPACERALMLCRNDVQLASNFLMEQPEGVAWWEDGESNSSISSGIGGVVGSSGGLGNFLLHFGLGDSAAVALSENFRRARGRRNFQSTEMEDFR